MAFQACGWSLYAGTKQPVPKHPLRLGLGGKSQTDTTVLEGCLSQQFHEISDVNRLSWMQCPAKLRRSVRRRQPQPMQSFQRHVLITCTRMRLPNACDELQALRLPQVHCNHSIRNIHVVRQTFHPMHSNPASECAECASPEVELKRNAYWSITIFPHSNT